MKIYLAGAIEAAPDDGRAWRAEISEFLDQNLGWTVFDPSQHEQDFLTENEKTNFRRWKTTDIHLFRPVISKIIDRDMHQLLNECDAVIVLWDEHVVQGGGTHGELTLCYEHKIPVYMVLGMPITQVSSWIVGCTTEVFQSFAELKSFLLEQHGKSN